MTGELFSHKGATLHVTRAGSSAPTAPRLLLLHGWRQPASSLLPTISTLQRGHSVIMLDTPGNGIAAPPPEDWGIEDYVDMVAAFMATLPRVPTTVVCHSFGCRLAMRLAAQQVPWLKAIVVIGGHGLKPIRPLHRRLRLWAIVRVTKIFGLIDRILGTGLKARWASRFGSADYRAADAMRTVFVRIINDDVTPLLDKVQVPVLLLYGASDTETPPAMGRKYNQLLPRSTYIELPGDDHYTVLTSGAGLVQTRIKEFLQEPH